MISLKKLHYPTVYASFSQYEQVCYVKNYGKTLNFSCSYFYHVFTGISFSNLLTFRMYQFLMFLFLNQMLKMQPWAKRQLTISRNNKNNIPSI